MTHDLPPAAECKWSKPVIEICHRDTCLNSWSNSDLVHTPSKSACPKTEEARLSCGGHEAKLLSQSTAALATDTAPR